MGYLIAADYAAGVSCIEREMTAAEELLVFGLGHPHPSAPEPATGRPAPPAYRSTDKRLALRAEPPAEWALQP